MKSAFSIHNTPPAVQPLNKLLADTSKKQTNLPSFLITKQDESFAQDNDAALVESLFIGDSQADPLF